MVTQVRDSGRPAGLRGQLGELCHSSGLLGSLQRMRSWLHKDLRILAYHRITPLPDPDAYEFDLELISASPAGFREQMRFVRDHYHPISLSEVATAINAGKELPTDAVVITFDDGYSDNYHVAYPILRELGVPATFFVSTGHIDSGRPFAYDWLVHMILLTGAPRLELPELEMDVRMPASRAERRVLAAMVLDRMKELDAREQSAMTRRLEEQWRMPGDHAPQDCRPMSWDQVREMHAAGYEFGSHGVHHRMLSKLPQDELEFEVHHSRDTLHRELGPAMLHMSYPVGGARAFDQRVIDVTRDAGFELACCYISGTNAPRDFNRYALYRLAVERNMGTGWFAAMLALPSLMSYPSGGRMHDLRESPACSH
ncbi:polysaccharide deacetylase family protein [Dyella sp. C9]|uniref:polysaccharide deacetylase family protein n=1 Tax=Dyella sp. C9 TaxID=2202154 RepID=UPI001E58225D|nr:polysaccharide deacetylase family protein [Dyella sp. C9]